MAEMNTYTIIIEERVDPDSEAPRSMQGFLSAADLRDWMEDMLNASGPLDTQYTVRVSA